MYVVREGNPNNVTLSLAGTEHVTLMWQQAIARLPVTTITESTVKATLSMVTIEAGAQQCRTYYSIRFMWSRTSTNAKVFNNTCGGVSMANFRFIQTNIQRLMMIRAASSQSCDGLRPVATIRRNLRFCRLIVWRLNSRPSTRSCQEVLRK